MRILLDTHVLLWSQLDTAKLSDRAARLLRSPRNQIFFSAVSIWEIAIKAQLKRTDFIADPTRVLSAAVEAGMEELSLAASVASLVSRLPLHHRDPFDRLLVAQAIAEPMHLLTADTRLAAHSPLVMLV